MESLIEIDRLTGSVFLLRDLIQERFGLSLDDDNGTRLITNMFASRLKQSDCKSFLEYYYLLMSDQRAAEGEWRYMMATLTKSKSSFFRHADAMRVLVDIALPQLFSTLRAEPIRIWSASCARGEEPLSIAIALNEAGWFERAQIEIHASDVSYAVIETAMQGVYGEEKFRNLDIGLRDKYFMREQDGWQVAPELRKMIKWKVANLMDQNEVADMARSHIIFCRNVFIYFTGHAICKTLASFARSMPAGAYLFSDSGEFFTTLVSSSNFFEPLGTDVSGMWIRRDNNHSKN